MDIFFFQPRFAADVGSFLCATCLAISARISKFGKLDMAVILNVTLCFFLVLCVAVVILSAFTCLSIGIFWPMFEGHKTLSTTLDTFGPRDARIPFMSKKSPK